MYLGPVAEDIAYHPIYHPFNWRGWIDFGMGALGDMGAHLIDHPFWALGLDVSDEHRSDVDAVGHDADSGRSERAGGIARVAQPAAGPCRIRWRRPCTTSSRRAARCRR